jgi:hypothetical protein
LLHEVPRARRTERVELVERCLLFVVGGDALSASGSPNAGVSRFVWMPIKPSSPMRLIASVT